MLKKIPNLNIRKHIKHEDYVVDRFRNDSEFLKLCLKNAFDNYFKDGEIIYLLKTLRRAANAVGMSKLAKETGISRQNLYHMLSEKGNPAFRSMELLLKSFGYRLSIRRIKKTD